MKVRRLMSLPPPQVVAGPRREVGATLALSRVVQEQTMQIVTDEEEPVALCPMNLSFEDGMNGWDVYDMTSTTTRAHDGTHAAEPGQYGGYCQQRVTGLAGLQSTVDVTFWLYTEDAAQTLEMALELYNGSNVRVDRVQEYIEPAVGVWSEHTVSLATHVDTVTIDMLFWSYDQPIWVDDISVNFGCSEVVLP